MDDLTEVKLKVDGKASDGFLVRRLSLKEGVCRIPTAELVLCTKGDAIRMDELEAYVEKAAALEISRTDVATMRRTTRWFSGMVTSVEGCGVVAQSRDGEVFEYRMTIQPRLVNLCYSRSGRNFIQTTALEAVKAILAGFDVQYQNAGLPESAKLKQDFFQRRESDYAFLMRILASCGLSYAFRTPDQTGRVRPPMMHVGTGNALPAASDFLCDGKAVLPSAFSCAASRTEGGYCRMDSWRMRKSIGVDSIEVGFTNRAGTDVRGAAGTGDTRRMRMDEPLFADSGQGEIDRLVEEHLRKMRVLTAGWTGTTQCLEALPGNLLKVNHFYGRNSTEVVEALVFASTLDCTLPILPGESVFGEDDRVSMRIALMCLAGTAAPETVSSAAETASVATSAVAPDVAVSDVAGIFGAGGGGGESAALFVKQAVVTDLSGGVGSTNAAVKFTRMYGAKNVSDYVFTARTVKNGMVTDNEPFEVNFIQPVGGYGQGLFRMPRVGDRILVLGVPSAVKGKSDTYYLLGYLPGDEMPFTTAEELERRETDETYKTALPEEMMSLRFRTTGEEVKSEDLENKMGIRRAKLPNNCSELAFYNTHVGSKWDKDKKTWKDVDLSNDKDPVTKELFNRDRKVLANLQSTGDIQFSANHNLEMSARNLTFKGTGWEGQWAEGKDKKGRDIWELPEAKVSFDAINKFVVEAEDSITFKVGHNSITIAQGGISIKAPRCTDVTGPADASIMLKPITGVTVSGLNCKVSGLMTTTIGDPLGAQASFSSGTTTLSGAIVTQNTTSKLDFIKNEIITAAKLGVDIWSYLDHDKAEDQKGWQNSINIFSTMYSGVLGLRKMKDDRVETCLKFAQALIDSAVIVFERTCPEWMDKPMSTDCSNPMKGRDWLQLVALTCKAALWLKGMFCKAGKAVFFVSAADFLESTNAELSYGTFSVKTGKKKMLTRMTADYKTVATAAENAKDAVKKGTDTRQKVELITEDQSH